MCTSVYIIQLLNCLEWYKWVLINELIPPLHSCLLHVCLQRMSGVVQRSAQSTGPLKREIRMPTDGDSCNGGISVLYNGLSWYKFVYTLTYITVRQLFNTLTPPSHESPVVTTNSHLSVAGVTKFSCLWHTAPDRSRVCPRALVWLVNRRSRQLCNLIYEYGLEISTYMCTTDVWRGMT